MFVVVSTLLVGGLLAVTPAPPVTVSLSARSIQPGELIVLTLTTAARTESMEVRAFDRTLVPFRVDDHTWRVLVGIDLGTAPGAYLVSIRTGPLSSAAPFIHRLVVRAKAFPTRRLTVDEAFVNPPAAVLERIENEARILAGLWVSSADTPLWAGVFVRPVPQTSNSAFGSRSVLNGSARSPHGGADFASPSGTPVRAPNGGRVVLARGLYYTGNTVVIDHGAGLVSLFAHLSAMAVGEGETVASGAVLGQVGATGRVTGPHLHWAVRAGGARVDPLSLLSLLGSN